jgi:tripartite-type tricarboxylate transporter receptor subunit TctC
MRCSRREVLHLAVGAAAVFAMTSVARAQAYPARRVRWIVPLSSGSGQDIVARLMGQWLSNRFGQRFGIENRPGAGSNIGTEAVVRAPADGYTLLLVSTKNAISATLYERLNFNIIQDIMPIAAIMRVPNVMEVSPSVPVKTIPELIAYARANPDKLNMASGGVGSFAHLAGELFKMMAGVNTVHVPYRGGTLPDLLGGRVQVSFGPMPAAIEHVKAATLRALAVTTSSRSDLLPDLPTVGGFLPGYESTSWFGLAPKSTPIEIIEKLDREINAALADREMQARLADLGGTVLPGSPSDFGNLISEETEKWAKVIQEAHIKTE